MNRRGFFQMLFGATVAAPTFLLMKESPTVAMPTLENPVISDDLIRRLLSQPPYTPPPNFGHRFETRHKW
jgi:hypothetical protein